MNFRFLVTFGHSCAIVCASINKSYLILHNQCLKTQHLVFRQCRNPNKGLFELAVVGFQSFGPGLYRLVPNYFKQTKVSEIRTICSDFRHFCVFKVIWYQTEGDCLKSEHVWISDVYSMYFIFYCFHFSCTVTMKFLFLRLTTSNCSLSTAVKPNGKLWAAN